MDAELVLDRQAVHVVACTEGAVGIDQKFWHEKQRRALDAVRRSRHARQHHMDDVAREIVLTVGDENFLPGDEVAAVARGYSPECARRTDRNPPARFRQIHRSGPLAAHHFRQVQVALSSSASAARAHQSHRASASDRAQMPRWRRSTSPRSAPRARAADFVRRIPPDRTVHSSRPRRSARQADFPAAGGEHHKAILPAHPSRSPLRDSAARAPRRQISRPLSSTASATSGVISAKPGSLASSSMSTNSRSTNCMSAIGA